MKKTFKKILTSIKRFFWKFHELIVWYSSRRVLDAINNGATYEEVEKIVKEEVNR